MPFTKLRATQFLFYYLSDYISPSPPLVLVFTWNQNTIAASVVLRDRPQVLFIFVNLINKRKDLSGEIWGVQFFDLNSASLSLSFK